MYGKEIDWYTLCCKSIDYGGTDCLNTYLDELIKTNDNENWGTLLYRCYFLKERNSQCAKTVFEKIKSTQFRIDCDILHQYNMWENTMVLETLYTIRTGRYYSQLQRIYNQPCYGHKISELGFKSE